MRLSNLLPDKLFLKRLYRKRLGKKLNLKHPKTFNEKIQWLKIHERTPLHTLCADKYAVRSHIKAIVGEQYLVPLFYHTQNVKEVNMKNLPDTPFIIKTNHDSSGGIIVRDKSKVDWHNIQKQLKKLLSKNYYYHAREWQYKNIKPQIIIEKLLEDKNGELPEYNFHCFNGKVQFIRITIDKDTSGIYFDCNWKVLSRIWATKKHKKHRTVNKPSMLDEMILIAEKLASPFAYARIDFYDIDGKVFCGEITLAHIAGFGKFEDEAMDRKLGDMIKLPID